MAGEWPLVQLGDICDLFDGPHQTAPLTDDGPVVYLNVGDIREGRIELRLSGRVSEEAARSWSRRVVPEAGDVVFGYEATLGHAALLSSGHRWCLGRRVGLLRPRPERVDPRFLAYSWYSPRFQETLRANRVGGSTIESIRLTDLPSWRIALPDLDEQRAIAHILGTLDDKIELNRRTNETLEAIARALFKSWFVDFDPVRAKSEGRDPGLPPHLADLFPDSLDNSELGEIPKGWRVTGLDETATYLNGLALQKYPPNDGGSLPVIKIAQLRAGHTDGADRASVDIPPAYVVEDGDVLFSWSGSLEVEIWCGGRGALNQHLFKLTSGRFPKWFYFLWTRHHLPDFRGIAAGKATTMGHIQRGHLSAARALVPPPRLVEAMSAHFEPLLDNLIARRLQSRTLAALRDALLPKLIAGELRVSDAERSVGSMQ